MTTFRKDEIDKLAKDINARYDQEEVDYLVSLLGKKKLDEVRKGLPYGTYALQ